MGDPVNFYSKTDGNPVNFYSRPENLLNEAVLYLGFDTGFSDYTGNHTTISTTGTTYIDATNYAYNGGSGYFSGAESAVLISSSTYLNFVNKDVTFDMFFFTEDLTKERILFSVGTGVSDDRVTFLLGGPNPGNFVLVVYGSVYSSNVFFSGNTLNAYTWYRATLVKHASVNSLELYLNTVLYATNLCNVNSWVMSPGADRVLRIGALSYATSVTFMGNIDEFAIIESEKIPGGQPINFYSKV